MNYARGAIATDHQVVFARRVITRPVSPDDEDHDTLSEDEFFALEDRGAFALSWTSHGLHYGIPNAINDVIRDGGTVIANISRGSIDEAAQRYANVVPILITVPRDILAQRLAARGRESASQIEARLSRSANIGAIVPECRMIENSGTIEQAGEEFVQIIKEAARISRFAL